MMHERVGERMWTGEEWGEYGHGERGCKEEWVGAMKHGDCGSNIDVDTMCVQSSANASTRSDTKANATTQAWMCPRGDAGLYRQTRIRATATVCMKHQ